MDYGLKNGVMNCENISFGAEGKPVTRDGQVLIGSAESTPGTAMLPGGFVSPKGTLDIRYEYPNIAIDVVPEGPVLSKAANACRYIVDKDPLCGNYTTIQAAIDAASEADSSQIVLIRPGRYTEDLTLKFGVSLVSLSGAAYGSHVIVDGTAKCEGFVKTFITGIQFECKNGPILEMKEFDTSIVFKECCFVLSAGAGFDLGPDSRLTIDRCNAFLESNTAHAFKAQGDSLYQATIKLDNCSIFNRSSSPVQSVFEYTDLVVKGCTSYNPFLLEKGCFLDMTDSKFYTLSLAVPCLVFGDSNESSMITSSSFRSGEAPSIRVEGASRVTLDKVSIDSCSKHVIVGAGTLQYNKISFMHSSGIDVAQQTVFGTEGPRVPIGDGKAHLMSGEGNPDGLITAPKGSIWTRVDAGAGYNSRIYVNKNGTKSWTALLTES